MANDSRNLSLGEARLNNPPQPSDLSQPSLKTQGMLSLETQGTLCFETQGMLGLKNSSSVLGFQSYVFRPLSMLLHILS